MMATLAFNELMQASAIKVLGILRNEYIDEFIFDFVEVQEIVNDYKLCLYFMPLWNSFNR